MCAALSPTRRQDVVALASKLQLRRSRQSDKVLSRCLQLETRGAHALSMHSTAAAKTSTTAKQVKSHATETFLLANSS